MSSSDDLKELNIRQLLDGSNNYTIPIYQRNYSWDEKEIEQLIQDILDYLPRANQERKNYFIGTLIVNENIEDNTILYETIDGQQRLTTLSLLACVIKHKSALDWYENINLSFQSRPKSSKTLVAIF